MPHRLIKSADGYRGTFLFLAGFMFLSPSVGWLFDGRALNSRQGLEWMPEFVHVWHLGAVFVTSCLIASTIGLFSRRLMHRPKLIGYGYVAAMAPPVIVTVLGVWAMLNGASPLLWLSVLPMYVTLAAMVYLGSEWPNPPEAPPQEVP